jgi:hypothetical protein
VSDVRALFLENPELIRNLQIELRPRRMLTAGLITAIFALIVLPSLLPANRSVGTFGSSAMMTPYLLVVLWVQKLTLTLGGAISCWRCVRRERQMNTFDFQRITRLSPIELTVGKLFGAPALAYFVTLCLVPPALLSALTSSSQAPVMVLETYIALFAGALMIHAFALTISTISDKGGNLGAIGVLLLLQIFPAIAWLVALSGAYTLEHAGQAPSFRFYGLLLPQTLLWTVLELGFAAWLLLAVVRNIKNDLEAMQLYTPWQGLGFAAYCNFVWIGFYPWPTGSMGPNLGPLLFLSTFLFYVIGVGVLQTRESVRRELRESRMTEPSVRLLFYPLGTMWMGALVTAAVIVMIASSHGFQSAGWRMPMNLFLLLYVSAWMARDLFYLQWMKVRPVSSPLRKAFLYLGAFYISTSILLRSAFTSYGAWDAAFSDWFAPFSLFREWMSTDWNTAAAGWLFALAAQIAAALAFASLYRLEALRLGRKAQPLSPTGPARLSSTPA